MNTYDTLAQTLQDETGVFDEEIEMLKKMGQVEMSKLRDEIEQLKLVKTNEQNKLKQQVELCWHSVANQTIRDFLNAVLVKFSLSIIVYLQAVI